MKPNEEIQSEIVALLATRPTGMQTSEICRKLRQTPQELGDTLEDLLDSQRALGFGGLWFVPELFQAEAAKLTQALAEIHSQAPNLDYVQPEDVAEQAGLPWRGKPLARIVSALEAQKKLTVSERGIRLKEFVVLLTPRQQELLNRVLEHLKAEPIVPTMRDISRSLAIPIQAAEEIVRLGVEVGDLVNLEGSGIYTKTRIEQLKEDVRKAAAGNRFSVSFMREALGTSRKHIIPLLEFLDETGFTERDGDERFIRA